MKFNVQERLRDLLGIDALEHSIRRIHDKLDRPPPAPPRQPGPFVCAIAIGLNRAGERVSLGAAGRVDEFSGGLTLKPYQEMTDVSCVVFADLERVAVYQIVLGVMHLAMGPGDCPAVFFPRWDIGIELNVRFNRRS